MTTPNYAIETNIPLHVASESNVLSHSERLAQTVALLQNSINEEEKKLAYENKKFVDATFNNDKHKADNALRSIAGLKGKIEAYSDCSELILNTMQY